jgi:hypothetical protein
MSQEASASSLPVLLSVGRARALAGAVAFKAEGIPNVTDTYKGLILTSGGDVVAAVIKDLPARELANEVLAASLGYNLRLPGCWPLREQRRDKIEVSNVTRARRYRFELCRVDFAFPCSSSYLQGRSKYRIQIERYGDCVGVRISSIDVDHVPTLVRRSFTSVCAG